MQLQQGYGCTGVQVVGGAQLVGAWLAAPAACCTSCSAYGTTQPQQHTTAGACTEGCTLAALMMHAQCTHPSASMTYPVASLPSSCSMGYHPSSSISGCSPGTFSSCSVDHLQEAGLATNASCLLSAPALGPCMPGHYKGSPPFTFQLHHLQAPTCSVQAQQQGSVHSTPALLTTHSSARSSGTCMDSGSCNGQYHVAGSLLVLAQEQIVMGVQLSGCEAVGSSQCDACMQSAFQQPERRTSVTSSIYQPVVGCKRAASMQPQDNICLTSKCPRISRTYASMQWSLPAAGCTGEHTALVRHSAHEQAHGCAPAAWQLTPCDALQPCTMHKQVPSAPRLLRQLSPASIKRCCQVGSSALVPNMLMPCRSLFQDMSSRNSLQLSGMKRLAANSLAPSISLPPDALQFFGAAMRLCGYTEERTIKLASHCWQRVQDRVIMDLPRLALQLRATGCDCADLQRAVLLAVLWLAGKCEEPRIQQAKASVVWCLVPASLASLGASCLARLETRVMSLLDWSPYRGLNW